MEKNKPILGYNVMTPEQQARKILGVSWALFVVALSLGYTLGLSVGHLEAYSRHQWLAMVPPVVALALIYRKLNKQEKVSHDGSAATGEKQK